MSLCGMGLPSCSGDSAPLLPRMQERAPVSQLLCSDGQGRALHDLRKEIRDLD